MSSTATPIDRACEEATHSSQDPLGEMNREIFVRDYLTRTAGSRESKIRNADHHVDKSSIVFGGGNWLDELNYPIVMQRADGSRLHDIDGNDYVDVLQGLGANLFGHNPEFVRSAIAEQLEQGFPIGVQTCLAAEVAKQITCLTGMDRVCFSNTGTEAVMTAIRVARAATGRRKVAIFTNSYHGHTDTVLMRAPLAEYARKGLIRRSQNQRWLSPISRLLENRLVAGAAPASIGIPASVARDVIVLDYGNPRSLKVIKSKRTKLAAVLVEPVQSRNPELQPREFLHELREITRSSGTALVFDEMVTGFRVHPAGAQGHFDVDADLATYSKIVGGGLPLSVIAGRGPWLDRLQSRAMNSREKTAFFAGTFCKHPLSLAASKAILSRLIAEGEQFQLTLNERTASLVERLNQLAANHSWPVRWTHFGSFFSIAVSESQLTPEQIVHFSHRLLHAGIHLRRGDRGGFLTSAHSDADVEKIFQTHANGLEAVLKGES